MMESTEYPGAAKQMVVVTRKGTVPEHSQLELVLK